ELRAESTYFESEFHQPGFALEMLAPRGLYLFREGQVDESVAKIIGRTFEPACPLEQAPLLLGENLVDPGPVHAAVLTLGRSAGGCHEDDLEPLVLTRSPGNPTVHDGLGAADVHAGDARDAGLLQLLGNGIRRSACGLHLVRGRGVADDE